MDLSISQSIQHFNGKSAYPSDNLLEDITVKKQSTLVNHAIFNQNSVYITTYNIK